ncbi:MAG: DegT/DnrJ/EryC1/StrS family aminotransferase [Elusimicrobia bacterium]|nr:DegT/DnrJ/EryC1/StrS family aminotransferase [Elusimicrobiota bacterium]
MTEAPLASVYCPPEARAPWTLGELLSPAQVRYYGLGRNAMSAAFSAGGLRRGDTVRVPAFICEEALYAASTLGCSAAFYPVRPDLGPAADPADWPKAAAVAAVDFFGFPQDLSPFRKYVERTHALLIEDNAHGLFSRAVDGAWLGLRGDAGVFSLRKTIALSHGGALAIPPGSRIPVPDQGLFQRDVPTKWRVKEGLRSLGRKLGGEKLRWVHRLARGGGGGGVSSEGDALPPIALAGPLSIGDPELEVERRRALWAWCDEKARPLGAKPVYDALPAGTSPFTYAYRASASDAARVEEHFAAAGLDVFSWPKLPGELEAGAPVHTRDVRCVRFLW